MIDWREVRGSLLESLVFCSDSSLGKTLEIVSSLDEVDLNGRFRCCFRCLCGCGGDSDCWCC